MLASRSALAVAVPRATRMLAPVRASRAIRTRAARDGIPQLDAEELSNKAKTIYTDATSALKAKWENTDDKPAAVLIGAGTIIALTLALNLVNTVDKIPFVSDFVELVGIGVTGWFTYRYLTVGADKDELFVTIKTWFNKIYGSRGQ